MAISWTLSITMRGLLGPATLSASGAPYISDVSLVGARVGKYFYLCGIGVAVMRIKSSPPYAVFGKARLSSLHRSRVLAMGCFTVLLMVFKSSKVCCFIFLRTFIETFEHCHD